MRDEGWKTLAIIMMSVILVIVLVNPSGTDVIYENTNIEIGNVTLYIDGARNVNRMDIKQDWMVYMDDSAGNTDIVAKNTETGGGYSLSSEIYNEQSPKVDGDDAVWSYDVASGEDAGLWIAGMKLVSPFSSWSLKVDDGVSWDYVEADISDGVAYYVLSNTDSSDIWSYNPTTNTSTDLGGDSGLGRVYQISLFGSYMAIRDYYNSQTRGIYYNINSQSSIVLVSNSCGVIHAGDGYIGYVIPSTTVGAVKLYKISNGVTTTIANSDSMGVGMPYSIALDDEWVAYAWRSGTSPYVDSAIFVYNIDTEDNGTIAVLEDSVKWLAYTSTGGIEVANDVVYFTKVANDNYEDIYSCDLVAGDDVITDEDEDGMDDEWEQQIIDDDEDDDIETIEDVDPEDDYDGDGFTNIEEYEAHTDPTDPEDYPKPDPIRSNLLYIILAVVAIAVLIGLELGYYKSKHIKAINKRVPLGIVASIIAIAGIILYWVLT